MTRQLAVEAAGVSKTFLIPHEHRTTFKEFFLHPGRRTTYERNEALKNLSLEVAEGESFGVIGPNGSGKSTLLKILAGIYPSDAGHVRLSGKLSPFIELGVGFNMELPARDNIKINATLLGLTKRELGHKFDEILEFSELHRFVDQKLKNYSSGMLLRLAYAIAIQVPFEILLLDEVLAVGDESFQQKCLQTLDQMRSEGKTLIYVSHDLATVTKICDRAMLLRNGIVEAVGTPDEVIAAYRDGESTRRHVAAAGVA